MNGRQDPDVAAVFVSVAIDWDALEPGVYFDPKDGSGEAIDTTPETEQAVVYGVNFALENACPLPCAVRVTEVGGSQARFNPTLVAAATTHAVWEALGFAPTVEVAQRLENSVVQSQGTEACPLLPFA